MELNALEKIYKQQCCLKIFCTYSFKDFNCQNLRFFWNPSWFFSKNLLHFRLDIIEKQGIINLSCFVISRLPFFGKGEDAAFHQLLFFYKQHCIIKKCYQISLFFILQEVFHQDLLFFCFCFQYCIKFILNKVSKFVV